MIVPALLLIALAAASFPAEALPVKNPSALLGPMNEFEKVQGDRRDAIFNVVGDVVPLLSRSKELDKYVGMIFDLDRTWENMGAAMEEAVKAANNGSIVQVKNILDTKVKALYAELLRGNPKMALRREAIVFEPTQRLIADKIKVIMNLFEETSEKAATVLGKLEGIVEADEIFSTGTQLNNEIGVTSEAPRRMLILPRHWLQPYNGKKY